MKINKQRKSKRSNAIPNALYSCLCNCTKCKLHKTRRQVVIGRGSIPADILFIGEGPGKTEDLLGSAFIGPGGKLFYAMMNDAIASIEFDKKHSVCAPSFFVTNIVLCRPCDNKNGENRQPKRNEVLSCMSNIMSIVSTIKPKLVIFVGKISRQYFEKEFKNNYAAIQHPSFLLRQGGKMSPFYKQNVRILDEALRTIID